MRHCLALSLMFRKLSRRGAIVNSTKPCKRSLSDEYMLYKLHSTSFVRRILTIMLCLWILIPVRLTIWWAVTSHNRIKLDMILNSSVSTNLFLERSEYLELHYFLRNFLCTYFFSPRYMLNIPQVANIVHSVSQIISLLEGRMEV